MESLSPIDISATTTKKNDNLNALFKSNTMVLKDKEPNTPDNILGDLNPANLNQLLYKNNNTNSRFENSQLRLNEEKQKLQKFL